MNPRGPTRPSLLLTLLLFLLVVSLSQAQDIEWRTLMDSAETLYQKGEYIRGMAVAMKAMETADRRDDVAVSLSLNIVAKLYAAQARYAEAEPLYKRSIEIQEKTLGSDHPDTAPVINNLATLYTRQGLYAKAEPLYKRSLTIFQKAFGEDDFR